jgi:hypothetical protein
LGGFCSADHIGCASSAGERQHKVGFPLVEHGLITDRAGSLAVLLPVGFEAVEGDALALPDLLSGPFLGQRIGPCSASADDAQDILKAFRISSSSKTLARSS